jgi:hypothetical protein
MDTEAQRASDAILCAGWQGFRESGRGEPVSRPRWPGCVLPVEAIRRIREMQDAYDRDPEGYERCERQRQEEREEEERRERDFMEQQQRAYDEGESR